MSEKVTIAIDGARFGQWEDLSITRSYDTFDTASFKVPFDSENPAHREKFEPYKFPAITIDTETEEIPREAMVTGTMLTPIPNDDVDRSTLDVSCYSKPGELNDNNTRVDHWTPRYKNQTIDVIAEDICEPFGIGVQMLVDVAEIPEFKNVAYAITDNPLGFLIGLARQRDLLTASDVDGNLVFQRQTDLGSPVAKLEKGVSPLKSFRMSSNVQGFKSIVTAFKKARAGNAAGNYYSTLNPFVTDLDTPYRPQNITLGDARGADAQEGSLAAYKRMIANLCTYTATVISWRDKTGALWTPNTTIKIKAPRSMVYDFYEFLIRSVTFNKSANVETATLTLGIHGDAEALPWSS